MAVIMNNDFRFKDTIDDCLLKKLIINGNFKKIFFFSIDIMAGSPKGANFNVASLNSFYLEEHEDQNIAIGKLKRKMFKSFNDYRSRFFNSLDCSELENFSDVSFVFILLPYWEIERVL
jgi:hypothetical protein